MRKTLKYSILSIILIVIVALIFPTWTPKIKGENSVSMLEQVEINGTGHEVMIRGVDRTNPILIFVHGGPGCSEIPYVRKYQNELEQHFTVVHYDQRGSGKSYHFFEDYSNLTTDVLVDDLLALRDYVSKELGQEKVILI
ncbi:alpha/beta hydrolase, partial [Clostridioides difficile]